jgi:hypothetical protein
MIPWHTLPKDELDKAYQADMTGQIEYMRVARQSRPEKFGFKYCTECGSSIEAYSVWRDNRKVYFAICSACFQESGGKVGYYSSATDNFV